MKFGRKAQAAYGAVVVVSVIAALIIAFIILIPPKERVALLEGEESGDDTDSSSGSTSTTSSSSGKVKVKVKEKNYLLESPGRIDYLTQEEVEHPLPVAVITTKKEAQILAEKNFVSAENGLFTDKSGELLFSVDDLDNTENILLSLNIKEIEGEIKLDLNGEEIFAGEVQTGAMNPIALPKSLLGSENKVTISVLSPGMVFWKTNSVIIYNLQVVGEVTNLDAQYARNTFLVSDTEKDNLEKVMLRFQPECDYNSVGKLRITLNGKDLYYGIPDCELEMIPIEVSPTVIKRGDNEIEFFTEKGMYVLSHITLKSELKDLQFPVYYFEVSNEEYKAVVSGDYRLRVKLDFVDITDEKEGDLVLNGHYKSFETKEIELVADLSDDLVKGHNSLKIRPRKTLDIKEMRVDLVD
jgi:hypothetical protein